MTGQVEDAVILHPVQPASGLSACPGQDVTINCTIVRVTSIPGVVPPPLQWQYRRDIIIIYHSPSHTSDYYTVVSHVVGLTVMSNATINPLTPIVAFWQHTYLAAVFLWLQCKFHNILGKTKWLPRKFGHFMASGCSQTHFCAFSMIWATFCTHQNHCYLCVLFSSQPQSTNFEQNLTRSLHFIDFTFEVGGAY